jgi:hypothetical protein
LIAVSSPAETSTRLPADPSAAQLLWHCLVGFEGQNTYDIYSLEKTGAETIWVRPCYHDILKIIESNSIVRRWTINGNPGIGKSMFSYLIMSVLLRDGKRVIYSTRNVGPISLHKDEVPYTIPLLHLSRELSQPSTVYVVDGHDPGLDHRNPVPTFLVCSPQKKHWHDFMKGKRNRMLYMPVWTLDELEQCRAQLYPQVPAGMLGSLFAIVGGVPRFVLERASDMLAEGVPQNKVENAFRRFVQKQVVRCPSLEGLLACAGELDASDGMSHVLLHIIPDLPPASSDTQADDSKMAPSVPV